MSLPVLNLPPNSAIKIEERDGVLRIFDPLRRKWLVCTPEEWVRQNFTSFLIQTCGYPAELMANEVALKHNGLSRRCDTVVFSRTLQPLVIVEYKAPEVTITPKVFDQIARYNLVMGAKILIVSNGMKHYCCESVSQTNSYNFLKEIPPYNQIETC